MSAQVSFVADHSVATDELRVTSDITDIDHGNSSLVRVNIGPTEAFLRLTTNTYGTGNKAHINPAVAGIPEGCDVKGSVRSLTESQWRWGRLWHSTDQRTALWGLLIAIASGLIKLGFDVPESWVLITVDSETKAAILTIAAIGGLIGTFLVFWRGVWKAV